MKTNGNDKALEAYKIFPYVAWILTFGFALFVYNITQELKEITSELEMRTQILQEAVDSPTLNIPESETTEI